MLTKNKMRQLFAQGISIEGMAQKYNCSTSTIKRIARDFGVKTPTFEESCQNPRRLNKMKATCLARYGVDNPSKVPDIRKKIYATCKAKYGVEKPITLYNMGSPNLKSSFQDKVERAIMKAGLSIETEQSLFARHNRALNRRYSPRVDILIPDSKIVVECYGDYWHANPTVFSGSDKIQKFEGTIKAEKIWEFDRIRKNHIKSFGYSVIIIWESDFVADPSTQISRVINLHVKKEKTTG